MKDKSIREITRMVADLFDIIYFSGRKFGFGRGGGLRFVHEPKTLRFFTGRLEPVSDWPEKLIAAYVAEFGEDQ